jgi:rhodanese-related sulfurtransferase
MFDRPTTRMSTPAAHDDAGAREPVRPLVHPAAHRDTGHDDRPPRVAACPASRRRFTAAALLAASTGLGLYARAGPGHASTPDRVDLDAARAEFESGRAVLIDIREPIEQAGGVARGARLLPLRQLAGRLAEIPTDPAKPVLLICNTQNRSRAALQALRERGGYDHVRYVEGGMSEWARRGWPMVAPSR